MNTQHNLTGKPSVDRPWMQFYPEEIKYLAVPECTLNEYLKERCHSPEEVILHYYGTDMKWASFLEEVERIAKSLKILGVKVGDQLPVFFHSVPEFLTLLLAAEKVGAQLVCRDNLPHENAYAVEKSGSKIVFAHDYISQENIDALEGVGVTRFILLSPYRSADRSQIPDYIDENIQNLYAGTHDFHVETTEWESFLSLGDRYKGEYLAPVDTNRPLYGAYTSGSTGTSKQVIHSARTMLANIHQLALYGTADDFRPSWLVTVLPPCLIAVVNSMLLMAIASRKMLIMDPYVDVHDIDLEMMRYRPNGWPAVPMFVEVLMRSKRIPDDYDISHLFACGTGAETLNKGQWKRAQEFLKKHNSDAYLTAGYGLTEAGSSCFFPCPAAPFGKGAIGMPIPLNVVSVFKPNTQEELTYGEFGEICISTPAAMLGYDDEAKTREVLQVHADGMSWLHTGDFGYMDENGVLYVYGRGDTYRYEGGYLSEIFMENSIVDAEIPGLIDNFFVITEDTEHPGYFVPYLYVVLQDGYTVDDIRSRVNYTLKDYERPVEIIQISERPFFHFKTNRIGLAKEIKAKNAEKKQTLTGKPSVERPWMQYYPKEIQYLTVPECTMNEFLHKNYRRLNDVAMHYYGTDIKWEQVFCLVEQTVRALRAAGFQKDDQIPVFLRSVPEFIILLLAAEKIGASLLCRDNLPEENAEAVRKSGMRVIITHDFITQEEVDAMERAGVKTFITVSPYHFANREIIPEHIEREIQALYVDKEVRYHSQVMSWDEFLEAGDEYLSFEEVEKDIDRPLFRAYTSGSTGPSKQVIHSAHSMIGILAQMSFYGSSADFRPLWLVTILPPSLVAVVVSMLLLPLASNKLLIMDPFCSVEDLDLEMMRYRPNCWPLIPMFIEILMNSPRIPADYDMSHLFAAGAGCESFNNGQVKRAQKFLADHGCQATFTIGYGQSEAGSNATLPCPAIPVGNGNIGIPMPLNIISIFKPNTQDELSYGELGEICIYSPGNMLGYDDPVKTAQTLRRHDDGRLWLHTGDIGYIDDNGSIFAFGRGNPTRFGGGYLSEIAMENRVIDANIPGIVDAFFVIVTDNAHDGFYEPYLYVVLEDGYTVDMIREAIKNSLNDFENPVRITQLEKRPFFHFKTNRIGLARQMNVSISAYANQE